MDKDRVKFLKGEHKRLSNAVARAQNPENEAKYLVQLTIVATELQQINGALIESGSRIRVRTNKHDWQTLEVLTAYAIYRFHGNTKLGHQICFIVGDEMGMGGDSMAMKVSAFWSFLESTGKFNLCEAGKEIAMKYKDLDKYAVETLTGRIVAF
jgi:hypothetical protein